MHTMNGLTMSVYVIRTQPSEITDREIFLKLLNSLLPIALHVQVFPATPLRLLYSGVAISTAVVMIIIFLISLLLHDL